MSLGHWIAQITAKPALPTYETNLSLAEQAYQAAAADCAVLQVTALALQAKTVLDVGCGLGGKTVYYAHQGAKQVVGIEISPERAQVAVQFAQQNASVQIIMADAAYLPFRANAFDVILSSDTWEHLPQPVRSLQECARVVAPGGSVAISALPYYSPWGAHTWHWLPLLWLPSFLPRPWLFRCMAWLERRWQVNGRLPTAVRVDWTRPLDPAHTQKLTVALFEQAIANSGLVVDNGTAVVPIGDRFGGIMARIGRWLVQWPFLRECWAGLVVARLHKPF